MAKRLINTHHSPPLAISLCLGQSGIALFLAYMYQHCRENTLYWEHFSQRLDQCLSDLSSKPSDASLSSGITGVAWVLKHLTGIGIMDENTLDAMEDLDKSIMLSFSQDAIQRNYDLLNGLVGKGVYFLENPQSSLSENALKRIVDILEEGAIEDEGGLTWPSNPFEREYWGETTYNLGMAHGVPAIISFLSKVHQNNIAASQTKRLIESATQWLLQKESPCGHSRFPSNTYEPGESRLAWCYGDLGVSLALFHASRALAVPFWREAAIRVALQTTIRNLDNSGIQKESNLIDSGFCHGTAGLAHIYHRMFRATQQPEMQASFHYWLDKTLSPGTSIHLASSLIEHSIFDVEPDSTTWKHHVSLLEGSAGVGCVLLSVLQPDLFHWDRLFLTDIS